MRATKETQDYEITLRLDSDGYCHGAGIKLTGDEHIFWGYDRGYADLKLNEKLPFADDQWDAIGNNPRHVMPLAMILTCLEFFFGVPGATQPPTYPDKGFDPRGIGEAMAIIADTLHSVE